MIYLDNNATTAIDPAVIEEMLPFLTEHFANPSSGYMAARRVREALEGARERVASALGCSLGEVVFTSGGTEASNAALNSAVQFEPRGKHIITSAVEHSAVRRHCEELAKRGADLTVLSVDPDGKLSLSELESAIRPNTAVVSVMWANNETGVLFPIEEIADLCRRKGVLCHTDAVQAFGKVPIKLSEVPLNFLSISAHKFHGPKGVGALYVGSGTRFSAMVVGGSHESGRRAGTENVASIVGMGKAAEQATEMLPRECARLRQLRDDFEKGLTNQIEKVSINGAGAARLANTTNVSFAGVESQAVLLLLDRAGICCSAGSACKTGSATASHVLKAMGVPDELALGTLRFSFGRANREPDAERAVKAISAVVVKLRGMASPASAVV